MGGTFLATGAFDYTIALTLNGSGDTIPMFQTSNLKLNFTGVGTLSGFTTLSITTPSGTQVIDVSKIIISGTTATVPLKQPISISTYGSQITVTGNAQVSAVSNPQISVDTSGQLAATMLAKVYYMDSGTGKEIVAADNLGLGLVAGTSVKAVAKDIPGYSYNNILTKLTPTSSQDITLPSTDLVLQSGDVNNTTTTTGRQAVVFWYSKADLTKIVTKDTSIYVGDNWSGDMGFVSAQDQNGVALSYQQFIDGGGTVGTANLNTGVPGTYTVSYNYKGVSSTAKVTVKAKQTAVNVH
ncbi:bacterial Ig-like domain-containing protein, partial [Lactococcus garvieae]|uniref:bacterial Ig-like domain-containing protein n=1 Tax=Lactococcus garvieae TaxID=1363 RepID=UPI0022E8DF30